MFRRARALVWFAGVSAALVLPREASAQVNTFQACSPGVLNNCALIRLTTQLGIGPGGTNVFEIAVQNLGSQAMPGVATSIYFLSFLTGQAAAAPGTEVDMLATPTSEGGATISDASDWSVFESGDVIFLSALGNAGVGDCVAAPPVGGFGQMGQTCDADQFLTFSLFSPRAFDPGSVSLAGFEVVGLVDGNPSDSCNDETPCVITPQTPVSSVPEPGTLLLALTGLSGVAGLRWRRRVVSSAGLARS